MTIASAKWLPEQGLRLAWDAFEVGAIALTALAWGEMAIEDFFHVGRTDAERNDQ